MSNPWISIGDYWLKTNQMYKEHRFKPGQKVVCINTESRHRCALRLGEVYVILANYRCVCGSNQLIIIDLQHRIEMICQCGHTAFRPQSYYEWRFRPYVVS